MTATLFRSAKIKRPMAYPAKMYAMDLADEGKLTFQVDTEAQRLLC